MRIVATGLGFPEGPIALPDETLIVVEMARETLSRIRPDGRIEVIANIPGSPNGAALGPDGRVYVCNNGGFLWVPEAGGQRAGGIPASYKHGSIEVVDLNTGKVERLYDRCGENLLRSPNDLVFDKDDGFWFTDIGKRFERYTDRGFVYWARADGFEIREVIQMVITPNGIGLSPDGKILYIAETDTARLWAWEIIGPGEVRKYPWPSVNGGRMVAGAAGPAKFDSLAVASSGNVCVAALDSCCVVEISSDGKNVVRHPVPDMLVTNLCFGGADMRTAYITMSHMGKLAAMTWHEPGLKLNHCG